MKILEKDNVIIIKSKNLFNNMRDVRIAQINDKYNAP